ncbi:MAG: TIGR02391 family protein [Candidatus Moranbacteria bacterium]|nr:TIGR02391 family protein [Candidatus Moranbacteria bacterium]
MSLYKEIFPPIENLLEMEPEELAPFVLRYLSQAGSQDLNKHNFSLGTSSDFKEWTGHENKDSVKESLVVAWMWLEKELFIAPKPGQTDWSFITNRGKKVLLDQNFEAYKKGHLLPSDGLDPVLVKKVKPAFIRGDYDEAVFGAFKEVEVRVRKKAKLSNTDFGEALMKKAFGPTSGALVDQNADEASGEKNARMNLFCGAYGTFRNPSGHRNVDLIDPYEVADIIHFANQLLRIVDSINLD